MKPFVVKCHTCSEMYGIEGIVFDSDFLDVALRAKKTHLKMASSHKVELITPEGSTPEPKKV